MLKVDPERDPLGTCANPPAVETQGSSAMGNDLLGTRNGPLLVET